MLEEPDDVRMRANQVRDVQEREPHLRRDVAGGRQRERVGRVLLAQPRLQMLVEPPRGLHPRHDRPVAQRIAEDSFVLIEGLQQRVEQRWPGTVWMSRLRAATETWLRSISSVTIAGSVSI